MSAYERKLNEIIDEIFSCFGDMTLEQVASKAKLAISTVWKIEQRVTRLPRFKTVFNLAKAAGFELNLQLDRRLKLKRA